MRTRHFLHPTWHTYIVPLGDIHLVSGPHTGTPPQATPLPDDPRALAFARKSIMGGGIIGVASCLYGLAFAGPAGTLSPYEIIMLPFMGIFSFLMILVFGLNKRRLTTSMGIAFSIWLGFYTASNLAYELFNRPEFGNALIYIIWVPATYLYATAVADLRTAMRISCVTVGSIFTVFASFLLTNSPPAPGASHVWDALVVGIIAQPAMLAVIYGVARYREFYIHEHARLEQLKENAAELEEATKQARLGRTEAERANAAKSQFLTNVTHELRTPLNGILGLTEILQSKSSDGASSGSNLKYLDAIRESGKTLLTLVEDIVSLSTIEADTFSLHEGETDLETCMANCADLFHELPEAKAHTLKFDLAPNLPVLLADREILIQMCLSLLSNAGKFTPGASVISVSVFVDDGNLVVAITDQGVGIPQNLVEQLTAPFFQVDGSTSREQSGLGLGLALTKARVEAHDGNLAISTTPTGGTQARLIFPPSRLISKPRSYG